MYPAVPHNPGAGHHAADHDAVVYHDAAIHELTRRVSDVEKKLDKFFWGILAAVGTAIFHLIVTLTKH